ncbi:hypothetical protein SAMN04488107_2263 [Geodermatophilus saharensis]|uniref:Uncharacterized protein n=1 Tax=Geodermatophilus saharensis TaxID=1137994 RepID=A0A239DND3_9ACTN|nr:hypothetical protein [Geodermatophilus saharensis]SNS33669.1 hypothetical protein SAMN04488107_2263 [Geodermatophilus saharensis]
MTGEDRHERVEAARRRAEMTVHELWLRYVALGGNGDLFDLDAYLNGLLPLGSFDQNVLAVAVNEALEEVYRAARVPLTTPRPGAPRAPAPADEVHAVTDALLSPDGSAAVPRPQEGAPPAPPRPSAGQGEPGGSA